MEQVLNEGIMEKLNQIQVDISFIRENMVDSVMTYSEELRHESAMKDFKEGNVFSLGDVERERKNAGLEV